MKKIVIDTNVVVSATRSPNGTPAKIMGLVFAGEIDMYLSNGILEEYGATLAKKKLGISNRVRQEVIADLKEIGIQVNPKKSDIEIKDEDDRIFYDTAKASGAILITGDKHLLEMKESFIKTPAEYINEYKQNMNAGCM